MKLRARFLPGQIAKRLQGAERVLREAVPEAAAQALHGELRKGAKVLTLKAQDTRRFVGSSDLEDIAREFGTLEKSPSPWLAPVLPLARGPMRAAVTRAAARAISSLRKRRK